LSEEISGADADKEVVLITLTRPLIYVQPVAVDKAILVWLNYKNAYEYWNEQRSSLNTEVLAAMPSQWVSWVLMELKCSLCNKLTENGKLLILAAPRPTAYSKPSGTVEYVVFAVDSE